MKKNCSDSSNSEIDVPLSPEQSGKESVKTRLISSKSADEFEKRMEQQARYYEKMDKHIYKRLGFRLLVGCGIAYLVLVILDMVLINFCKSWEQSPLVNSFVELLKFVISTLIGYVFSETTKSKND